MAKLVFLYFCPQGNGFSIHDHRPCKRRIWSFSILLYMCSNNILLLFFMLKMHDNIFNSRRCIYVIVLILNLPEIHTNVLHFNKTFTWWIYQSPKILLKADVSNSMYY